MQKTSSGSPRPCKIIGPGRLLAYLRADLERVTQSVFVIGPWLDGYFTRELVSHIKQGVAIRCLVRQEEQDEALARDTTYLALVELATQFPALQARSLPTLHGKVIVLDDRLAYLGSTNWYRYSLEQASEITLRGELSSLQGLPELLERYWQDASAVNLTGREVAGNSGEAVRPPIGQSTRRQDAVPPGVPPQRSKVPEIAREIMDPHARKALEQNPNAFVLGRKRR